MNLTIDIDSIRQLKTKMRVMYKRVQDPSGVWKAVGSYIAASNRKQFATHGAYYGTPWKPLKPDYAQWKLRSGYGRKTLVKTGAMKASFTSRPMAIEKYYKKSAEYGSDYWLVKYHQNGTQRNGRQANPPRPMMKKTAKMSKDIKAIVEEYVITGRSSVRKYL